MGSLLKEDIDPLESVQRFATKACAKTWSSQPYTTSNLTYLIWSHSTRGIIALNNVIILNWCMVIQFFLTCLLLFLSLLIIPPVLITVFHLKYHFLTLILIFIPISVILLTHGTNLLIPLNPLILFLSSKTCLTVHSLSLRGDLVPTDLLQ